MPVRVVITPQAAALVRRLQEQYGPLMFHQSGGCCDGSAPMCFRRDQFRVGAGDVLLGVIETCPFYIGGAQFETWAYTQLIIDVGPAGGDSFSLEVPEGVRFITRSRVFTDAEAADLDAAGPPPRGPDALNVVEAQPR
ncbi:MAG TPA: DUF779 domain-containing protein [bacterium]|nr:DUF779 domain-containing protein [bacterium]